jgi:tetratricopeptide (TPR) repeat protein
MTTTLKIEDFDLPLETEEEVYASLLRALQRKQGFGLFFVQCTPAQGQDVMARLREDLGEKRLATVQVERETTTLYEEIEGLWEREPFDVLFVQGLEQALYGYEDTKRLMGWTNEEVYSYSWRGVPPILNHLNQRRDKLRNHFPACFVFLVPVFVVDYFLQRAADFLDWRSGLFILPRDPESLAKNIEEILAEGNYDEYVLMPSIERRQLILELKNLYFHSAEIDIRTSLLWKLGQLFHAEREYANAIVSFNQLIEINPNYIRGWIGRGHILRDLGRIQEAIADYDQAVKINPDFAESYHDRGLARRALGDYQGAITDYDQAVKLDPNFARAYGNRGNTRRALGDYQGAIVDYDHVLKISPKLARAYANRGNAHRALGDYQGAITDYDQAIKLNPDDATVYSNRGFTRSILGDEQGAITDYDQAIKLKPDDATVYSNRGFTRSTLGDKQGAIMDYDQAIKLKPDDAITHINRGVVRSVLGDMQGAITDYDQALKLNPYYAHAYYNRAYTRATLGDKQSAISDYQKAVDLYPPDNPWRQKAIDELKKLQ